MNNNLCLWWYSNQLHSADNLPSDKNACTMRILPLTRPPLPKLWKKMENIPNLNLHDAYKAATGNHVKPLNTASSDSELHRFRTKPLSNSLVNVANDVRFKQHSQDRDSLVSSSKQGILFSPIGLKHNVTEKVVQVGGLVRITAFPLYACLIFECHSALLCIRTILAY